MKPRVAIVRCPDYDPAGVRDAVRRAVDLLGGVEAFVRPDESVMIKPNLLSAGPPGAAVTTHPTVVESVIDLWKSAGSRIMFGDSPPLAGENEAKYRRLLEITGMSGVAERTGVEIVRFEEAVVSVPHPNGRYYRSFEVARSVAQADSLVSLPKLKTHGLTYLSSAVKNVFGVIPGRRKAMFHAQAGENRETFAQMLVDLLGAVPPRISIVDAVTAMDGDGPVDGHPRQVGLILAGTDPVALDAVACVILGVKPMIVDTTRLASEQGLGVADLGSIEVLGERIEDVACTGFIEPKSRNFWLKIPKVLRQPLKNQIIPFPVITGDCISCRACIEACPVETIHPAADHPKVELLNCIRCYCCREVCESSAIDLKAGKLSAALKLIRNARQSFLER